MIPRPELVMIDVTMSEKLPKYLSQDQIIKRGWNDSAIIRFLGSPSLKRLHPRTGLDTPYWESQSVVDIERTSAWKQWSQRKELLELVEKSNVTVNWLDMDAVKYAAVNGYNHLHGKKPDFRHATVDSDPRFLNRIIVNYLRHDQTNYDASLKLIARKVGQQQAYALLKNKVLAAIAKTYPDLREECISQRVSIQDVLSRMS